jgi:hypothetical protein
VGIQETPERFPESAQFDFRGILVWKLEPRRGSYTFHRMASAATGLLQQGIYIPDEADLRLHCIERNQEEREPHFLLV